MATGHKTGGRLKGTPNRITRAFRDAVQIAYDAIGGDEAFATWARENPTEFYRFASRLIPQDLRHAAGDREPLIVNILRLGKADEASAHLSTAADEVCALTRNP